MLTIKRHALDIAIDKVKGLISFFWKI